MTTYNNSNSSNKILVPEARQALNQMKLEIASELGMANYDSMDKGNLPSRQNGYVGGNMTRQLVQMAQQNMGSGGPTTTNAGVVKPTGNVGVISENSNFSS